MITFINTFCPLDCGPSNVTLGKMGLPWVPCVRGPGMCLGFMKRTQKRGNSYWELAQRLLGGIPVSRSYSEKLLGVCGASTPVRRDSLWGRGGSPAVLCARS